MSLDGEQGSAGPELSEIRDGGWTAPGNRAALLALGVGLVAAAASVPLINEANSYWGLIDRFLRNGDSIPWELFLGGVLASLAALVVLGIWLACVAYLRATTSKAQWLACGGIGITLAGSAVVLSIGTQT